MYIFPFFQPFSNDCPVNPMLLLILSYFYCNAFAISKFQNIGKMPHWQDAAFQAGDFL